MPTFSSPIPISQANLSLLLPGATATTPILPEDSPIEAAADPSSLTSAKRLPTFDPIWTVPLVGRPGFVPGRDPAVNYPPSQRGALLFWGVLSEVPRFFSFFDRALTVYRFLTNVLPTTAITRRGLLHYFSALGLKDYDFRGKRILDVGSGFSRFAKAIHRIFGREGTTACSLDAAVRPCFRHSVKGNANALPFSDKIFDLVVSNRLLEHYWESRYRYSMLEEMLRVTRPGGEIRIGFESSLSANNLYPGLYRHPEIEEMRIVPVFGGTKYLRIRLCSRTVSPEELSLFYLEQEAAGEVFTPWRRGLLKADPRLSKLNLLIKGSSAEKRAYLATVRRFLALGEEIDPHYKTVLKKWLSDSSLPFSVRQSAASVLLTKPTHHLLLVGCWRHFSEEEKNDLLLYWLRYPIYRSFLICHPELFEKLRGQWRREVVTLREEVFRRIALRKEEAMSFAQLRSLSNY